MLSSLRYSQENVHNRKLSMKQTEWLPHIDNKHMEVHVWQDFYFFFNIYLGHSHAALHY